jgi:uncharacterized RDD family membrane protein YckC
MNQQFYIAVDGKQTGPFSHDDLRTKNIKYDTLIWTEGLDSWTNAAQVVLVKDILKSTPPPIPNMGPKSTFQQAPPPPVTPQSQKGEYFGYKLAGRGDRFVASLVEAILLIIPMLILFGKSYFDEDVYSFASIVSAAIFSALLGAVFYTFWSGNLGHKIMGLKVISSVDGSDQNNALAGALRESLKDIFSLIIIPVIWILWDKNKQNLYDKVVKTYVVKKSRYNNEFYQGLF